MIQHGDITIQKEGASPLDENQTFLFRITGPDGFDMDVVVEGNGSATIKNLPVGDYTVTELAWGWRYELDEVSPENGSVTLEYPNLNQTVTFTNERTENKWLSGDCYAENAWSGNTITATGNVNTNAGT